MTASVGTFLGVDLGGTKIAAGLVLLPEGRILARRQWPTKAARGGQAVLEDVLKLARELAAEATQSKIPIRAMGLGICELVDRRGQLASANCVDWLSLDAKEELEQVAPTTFEADVRAAAMAEYAYGAGRHCDCFLYITIGTGISGCLMLEGRPYLGARGATGTMASSPLGIPCPSCGSVNARSIEDIASGPALVRGFRDLGGSADDAREVLAAATRGLPAAIEVVQKATQSLGSQIGLLVSVLDPEAIVIGGGLGLSGGLFWDGLITATRRHIWSPVHRDLPIRTGELGADAGWIGAAIAAWRC